jgi:hypothetical protein
MNINELKTAVCKSLCADVQVIERNDGYFFVDTPFEFGDGDHYSLFLKFLPTGGVRITDRGTTFMRMSYLNDLTKFRDGSRGRLLDQVVTTAGLQQDDGEFFIDVAGDELGASLVRFGQAITRVYDLTFLNKARVASTFYEDLREQVQDIVGGEVVENYIVPGVPMGEAYPVDLFVQGERSPVYIFGVPDQAKARLATIIIQYLRLHLNADPKSRFKSLVVFQDQASIPHKDRSRLINAASMMVDTLDARDDMRFKLDEALH